MAAGSIGTMGGRSRARERRQPVRGLWRVGAQTLHIANGTATTTLVERAGIAGDRSVYADAFHDGPVPDGLSDEALREVRARHFAVLTGEDDWHGFFAEVTRWDAAV